MTTAPRGAAPSAGPSSAATPSPVARDARTRLRIAAGAAAAVWAALATPPAVIEWDGDRAPEWLQALDAAPLYQGVREAADAVGWSDHYLLFGLAAQPAILLAWWAMYGPLRLLGGWGAALSLSWLLVAPASALSYLNHDKGAPLHVLWGVEGLALLLAFVLALVAGLAGGRRTAPGALCALVACSALFGIGMTAFSGYYPHGTYIGLGILAVLLALVAARSRSVADAA